MSARVIRKYSNDKCLVKATTIEKEYETGRSRAAAHSMQMKPPNKIHSLMLWVNLCSICSDCI